GPARWRGSGRGNSTISKIYSNGWTNDQYSDRNPHRRRRTRDAASAGKTLARAHAAAFDRGMADEERLPAGRRPPLQSSRRLGRRAGLRSARHRAEQGAHLHLEFQARGCGLRSAERGDLYAHTNAHGNAAAHGAVGLPAGSEAGFWRRQGRMAAILREAGGGFGAGGLKSAASRFPRFKSKEVSLNLNMSIRQIHRWLSIVFTATVIANFVA